MCDGLGITYSQSKMEQIMVLSCNNTRKHQFWSTGDGETEQLQCSPPGMQRPPGIHSDQVAHGACKHPFQNRVAWRHPATTRDSRDYLSSWFAFQVVDSTQNKTQNGHNFPHSDLYRVIAEHKSSSIQTYF